MKSECPNSRMDRTNPYNTLQSSFTTNISSIASVDSIDSSDTSIAAPIILPLLQLSHLPHLPHLSDLSHLYQLCQFSHFPICYSLPLLPPLSLSFSSSVTVSPFANKTIDSSLNTIIPTIIDEPVEPIDSEVSSITLNSNNNTIDTIDSNINAIEDDINTADSITTKTNRKKSNKKPRTKISFAERTTRSYILLAQPHEWKNSDGSMFPISVKNLCNYIQIKRSTNNLKSIEWYLTGFRRFHEEMFNNNEWDKTRKHPDVMKLLEEKKLEEERIESKDVKNDNSRKVEKNVDDIKKRKKDIEGDNNDKRGGNGDSIRKKKARISTHKENNHDEFNSEINCDEIGKNPTLAQVDSFYMEYIDTNNNKSSSNNSNHSDNNNHNKENSIKSTKSTKSTGSTTTNDSGGSNDPKNKMIDGNIIIKSKMKHII